MAIHPPLLYAGMIGMTVPFAFGIAALAARQLDNTWLRAMRRWLLIPWTFLGAGLLFESATGKHRAVLLATRSYASAGPPVVRIFSIAGERPVAVVVTWPDGNRERFALDEPGRTVLEYGEGVFL